MLRPFRRAAIVGLVTLLCLTGLSIFVNAPSYAAAPPTAPKKIKVAVTKKSAKISWKKSKRAQYYRVCIRKSKKAKKCARTSKKTAKTSITVKKLQRKNNKPYYFRVKAYGKGGKKNSKRKSFRLIHRKAPGKPKKPVASRTTNSISVSWPKVGKAKTYDVCLRTNLKAGPCYRRTAQAAQRQAVFTNLKPTPGVDYTVQVRALNKFGQQVSPIRKVNLPVPRVAAPTITGATTSSLSLTWKPAVNAGTYLVQVSTGKKMKAGLRSWRTSAPRATLTGLAKGQRYFVHVRGENDPKMGKFSTPIKHRLPTADLNVRVVSYNLCGEDKCRPGSSAAFKKNVPPWSVRKPLAGAILRATKADFIGTQESQKDRTNIASELEWAGYVNAEYRSAKELFYKTSRFTKLRSGPITLSASRKRYAVWAEFAENASGIRFIVSNAHFEPGKTKPKDDFRTAETKALLKEIAAQNPENLPVIYAGDFNSNQSNVGYPGGYDAPLRTFTANGKVDSFVTAETWANKKWNSANQGRVEPLKHAHHVDHVFIDPSIQVRNWRVKVKKDGKKYQTPFASDHNPIQVDLSIPQPVGAS